MTLTTIIGRGHSGTRILSHTLIGSGVYMGEPLNSAGDLIPADKMYCACEVIADHIKWRGGLDWDWSKLSKMIIPQEFTDLVYSYLRAVPKSRALHKGWKLPETLLCLPWIVRMFPDTKYIYWIRDPRDSIIGPHITDNLRQFGIDSEPTDNIRLNRAISWIYQYKLVKAMPKPKHWIEVRFEDFVLRQDETLTRLEMFLGYPLAKIVVRPEAVGRWKTDEGANYFYFDFFDEAMRDYGYS